MKGTKPLASTASAARALRSDDKEYGTAWTAHAQLDDLIRRVGIVIAATDAVKIADEKHAKWKEEFDAAVARKNQAATNSIDAHREPKASDEG